LAPKPPATIKPAAPYNPYASGSSTPQLQDPITNAIASGSTGAGFDDTVTPTGVNTDAPGAFQEETQGKTASGSPVPFNQPPPPPPPPPMSASDYSALSSGGVTAPAPNQTRVLPQGSMTPEQYRQASQMNSGNTGVQPPTSASDYAAISRGTPPVAPAAQPTMTASDYSAISRGTAGTSTPNNAFDDTVTPTGRSTEVPVVTPRDTPTVVDPYASGTSTPRTETQSAPFDPYASGTSTPNNTFDDTVTPTGQSTEVATSAPRDLPSMADAQAPRPTMTADDYQNILRGETQDIRDAIVTADDYNRLLSGQGDRIVEAVNQGRMTADDYQNILRGETQGIRDAIVTADDYNRLLSGAEDRITSAINADRMTADDYQNILRGETQDIRDSIVTADDYNRLLSGAEDRITSAFNQDRMTADDYQNILRGETQSIREAIDADKVTADDYARILSGELTARDERQAQERQAREAAEAQERAAKQAIEDRMNLQFNDRLAETLGSRRPVRQIRTADDYRNVSTGETPFEPPEILERFDVDQDLEKQLREQADMAARQGDDGLRTFAASPEFNPNAAGLENLARRQDAGLETFAARGSRYNRGAEQLRRQAGQRPSGTLQDRLEQAYMGRIDAANDPILASQIADQQLRQQEAQQGLVEQLSRYGVLRGGGDTAAALTRMAEGNERNRLALEAAAAQRRQGDLRDASAFDQARSSMDIAQRGQSLEERIGADRLLDTALARDVTRAGQTGQFQGVDTLAAQEQRQRMNLAKREQDLREDIGTQDIATSELGRDVTRAGLTGQFQDRDTLQAQEQALRMDLARADATGRFEGGMTADERDRDLARRISEAGVTGRFDTERRGIGTVDTIQRQAIESSLKNEALNRALGRAGATGRFREEGDTADPTETLESRLRTAGLTGQLDDDITLAGRQAEQDLIGSILAASDPELEGRTDALAEALTRRLGEDFGPTQDEIVNDIQEEFEQVKENTDADSPLDRIRQYLEIARRYEGTSVSQALLETLQSDKSAVEKAREAEEQLENIGLRGRRNRTQQNRGT
tara:strand:+ start:4014 stop:7163 length:3150 start_codon:yes stop_codon:yes gene_type:complete